MNMLNTEKRYGGLIIALHWLTVLAIVVAYATMELSDLAPKGPARDLVKSFHYGAGICVLFIAVFRLGLYLRNPLPQITPKPPKWQEYLAHWTHRCLYLFMLLLPLLGWLIFSARERAVPLPGFELPALPLPASLIGKEISHSIKDFHELLANIGYALIGLHAAAALFHHYIMRDDTLKRMLPERKPR